MPEPQTLQMPLTPDEGPSGASSISRAALATFALTVPLDVMPFFGSGSITAAMGVVLAGAGVWQVVRNGKLRAPPLPLVLLTLSTAWAFVSLLWAHDTTTSATRLATNVQLLGFIWLAWQVARSREDVRWMAGAFVLGCGIAALGTWQSFLSGGLQIEDLDELERLDEGRYVFGGYDPNDMGVTLAIAIPLAVYLALRAGGRPRYRWLAYLPLGISGIALTGSRGALLTAAVAVAISAWALARHSRALAVAMLAILIAASITVWTRTPDTLERVFTLKQSLTSGTLGDRTPIWAAGLQLVAHHPILGVGIGGFPDAVAPYLAYSSVAHNTFLSVTAELGAVGALLFFGAFAAIAIAALRSARDERELVLGLVLTWSVGVSALTWEFRKTTWFLLLLGAAVNALRPRSREGAARPARAA
jgi:O-antigen ligase